MSLLQTYSIADAAAILRGEHPTPLHEGGFSLDGLSTHRLTGLEAAPGHGELDPDAAWSAVVRSWWGLGMTWGLCVAGEGEGASWNLVLPASMPTALDSVGAHLTGARLEPGPGFPALAGRLRKLPYQAAMAGHSGSGLDARLEPAVRSLLGKDFMIMVLAKPLPRPAIEAEIRRLAEEEQFARDEHLSRPGLEHDSHSAASRYLSLIEAARERADTALQEGGWQVRTVLAAANEDLFRQAQGLLQGSFAGDGGQPESLRWQDIGDPRTLTFLRTAEAAALARPPHREIPGFSLETRISSAQAASAGEQALFATAAPSVDGKASVSIGRILDDSGAPGPWLDTGVDDFVRHVLVAGMPNAGKSVTCEHLLLELWRDHQKPWLVIEPGMKASYRRLLHSEIGGDLEVWAIGDPKSRRLSLNPMAAPVGIGLAEHTSALYAVIASAFELVAPMPEVLATAIERTYENHGWDLAGLVPDGPPPRLEDLVREVDRYSRELGYGPEVTGNIRAGLLLRLRRLVRGPLAPELTAADGLDTAALVSRPTIIELCALPDAESQALVMGLLALQLRHHWRLAGPSDSLRHVTLIEEAHRLLRAVPETAANAARTRTVEDLANMLAELRAFGAGLVVVDQAPSALVPAVLANTGTKILHRLDHPDDRELAGRGAGLPADQVDILGALRVGNAIVRSDRRPRPFRVRVPNPSVTYAHLPLPELPPPAAAVTPPPDDPCPVCGAPDCIGRAAGRDPEPLHRRLRELRAVVPKGEEAARQWAGCELRETSEGAPSGSAPLCFLHALGRAAKIPEGTLQRLQADLAPSPQPPRP